uniref:Uncharacterized protein n=1 Tax=Arundo donax TaxID=35708 RepID=A0A0A8XS63_ARUDO
MLSDLSLDLPRCRHRADDVVDDLHVHSVLEVTGRRCICQIWWYSTIQLNKRKWGEERR